MDRAQFDKAELQPPSYVVGIGASAGGLEAIEELLRNVRRDRMAFVVVQHLAPDRKSILTELLARSSALEVVAATDGARIESSRVYVGLPDTLLELCDGQLRSIARSAERQPLLPIDFFFRSLANDLGRAAIGVVLSGTGSDGTFGLREIRAAGGLTFVQDPSTARFEGMPRSALAGGAADACLSPRGIAEELAELSTRAGAPERPGRSASRAEEAELQGRLFAAVRSAFGTDLSCYKPATVARRIERRMTLRKLDRLADYVALVGSNPDELAALHGDVLISVTSFFRDHDPFEALKSRVFPALFADPGRPKTCRVWIPACATGEEAYSIAIALVEYLGDRTEGLKIQIFGTEIDDAAIQFARRGTYPENIELDVSAGRLQQFFVKRGAAYRISRRIRDMVVFSHHDVIKDAPFSRMDLVSCRNLLIYLQPAVQKKLLRFFHYSLNPTGFLLLGQSETVGESADLFALVDSRNKLYGKKHSMRPLGLELGETRGPTEPSPPGPVALPAPSLQSIADRTVLEEYGPPGVVVSSDLEVVQFRGRVGRYLDPAPGTPSFQLLRLVRSDLHLPVKGVVDEALSGTQRVIREVEISREGSSSWVRIDAIPLRASSGAVPHLLVLFHELPSPQPVAVAGDQANGSPEASQLRALERELETARDYLRSTLEDKQAALEELQSANEELQSANEELQSTNEELETSREELQSTNEELTTLNDELQTRMTELGQSRDDLHNVLSGVDNAVVIVGMDLHIRRFTGAAERLLRMDRRDIGRPVGAIDAFLGVGVEDRVRTVLEQLTGSEEELHGANGRWYSLRIAPYRTVDHAIRGAVIVLADIDVRRRAEELTRDVRRYAVRFLAAIDQPLLILDLDLRIVWANERFLRTFDLEEEETVGTPLEALSDRQLASRTLLDEIEKLRSDPSRPLRRLELPVRTPGKPERTIRVAGSVIPAAGDVSRLLLLSFDIKQGAPVAGREVVEHEQDS